MSTHNTAAPVQLAFDQLLTDTVTANQARVRDRKYGHLPSTIEKGLPFFRTLIDRHHHAMVAGDAPTVMRLREEAHDLAVKLNNYEPGILADEDAPGRVLERLTRSPDRTVPLWGQAGCFEIQLKAMRVRIEMEGLFGIGSCHRAWLGFSAHAVAKNKPFLSETGYRSFLGVGGELVPGHTPDSFATAIVETYVAKELKGRLRRIVPLSAKFGPSPARAPV